MTGIAVVKILPDGFYLDTKKLILPLIYKSPYTMKPFKPSRSITGSVKKQKNSHSTNASKEVNKTADAAQKMNILDDKLLDRQDMLMRFYLSPSTLQRWRDNGKIPFVQLGRKIYYPQKLMEELFQHLLRKAVYFWWLVMMLPDDVICVGAMA